MASIGSPLVIENGTFAWSADKVDKGSCAVLHNINLCVREGSLVAVVGSVGAGKSSLCSAILGEMECQGGRVNVKVSLCIIMLKLQYMRHSLNTTTYTTFT